MKRSQKPVAYSDLLDAAHSFADLSGPATLKHFRKPVRVEDKGSAGYFDPVTVADRGAERVIVKALKARFPDHGILGEEFGYVPGEGPYRWVLDPIDGTRGFIMGSPLWGTLIGLMKDGAPHLGLVDQPFTGERFWSGPSQSYFSRDGGKPRRIKSRACGKLEDAVLTCTHPDVFETEKLRKGFADIKSAARLTRYGYDCYGYCLLASGFVDLIIESSLQSYDVVALIPIVERAGGRMTTWDGGDASDGGAIVASGDPKLHDIVLRRLEKYL